MEMKDLFPGYYRLSKEEFAELWGKCVFILDTNCILNLYRYNEETRKDFINVFRKIESRLWIPHQVALEFQENRTTVINEQENKFITIKQILNTEKSEIKGKLRRFSVNHESFLSKLNKLFDEFLEEIKLIENQQLKLEEQDYIRDIIDDLFKGKIGEPPTKLELENIYKEGEERYNINYPPGFKDKQLKKQKQEQKQEDAYLCNGMSFRKEYGDLILWKEILKEVKTRPWTHIIFITDDAKEDWWRYEQGKTIGARPELVEEICKAGASIFYMYTPERFLKFSKEYIEVDVKEESIQQVEEISAIRNDLLNESLATRVSKAEQAVLRWLKSEYPDDEIIQSPNRKIDFLRLTEDNSKIGYEIKYMAHHSMSRMLQSIESYITNFSNLELDELQVILITNNYVYGKALQRNLMDNIQKTIAKCAMMIQANTMNQSIKNLGVIIGVLYSVYDNGEFTETTFDPMKIIQNMDMDMEGM
ncbi:DUF4935 domain-containing protein [Microcoleus sp. FACHB-SPT15]|uniref:PIN-like domain-containing protein n=1 Tax=Microcoleus sp. FACHB-SPT15 TaxID=2692830 RepID=UPI00177EEFDD|nr:PIN-like domain-containing protein [Microcoleus sp. FACHB-SPT15]MBD1809765.1 DUF4935 domain-containing protein [Microcoleus sp. FACHB-SPT15]